MNKNLTQINGHQFYEGLVAGINNLLEYKNKLDEINVFPVPDGDTGTNMSFTLLPIVEECNHKINESISDSLNVIADTALDYKYVEMVFCNSVQLTKHPKPEAG